MDEGRLQPGLLGNDRRSPSVLELVSRLVAELGDLLDKKIALFKAELGAQFAATARNAALFAIGGLLTALGVLFLLVALALWVGGLMGTMTGGFALVGVAVTAGGGVLLVTRGRELRPRSFVPVETVKELRRDVQWIKDEM